MSVTLHLTPETERRLREEAVRRGQTLEAYLEQIVEEQAKIGNGLRLIRETERFQARLAEVVQAEAIPEWLDTPNEAFGGLKPLEVIERGEIDRLWNMIFYLESGVAC